MDVTNSQTITNASVPSFLADYASLEQHFRGQLEHSVNTTEVGQKFARFVQRLLALTDFNLEYEKPELNQRQSGDGGIDLIANSYDGCKVLYIQAKLWLDRAETIDNVVSKFQAYQSLTEIDSGIPQTSLELEIKEAHYMLVTLSRLDTLIPIYERKHFSSYKFYKQLSDAKRFHFLHGNQILSVLQVAYLKTCELPTNLTLRLQYPPIKHGNVYIGIIPASQLRLLYREFGEALRLSEKWATS